MVRFFATVSESIYFQWHFGHHFSVDDRLKFMKNMLFSNENAFVWMGPKPHTIYCVSNVKEQGFLETHECIQQFAIYMC